MIDEPSYRYVPLRNADEFFAFVRDFAEKVYTVEPPPGTYIPAAGFVWDGDTPIGKVALAFLDMGHKAVIAAKAAEGIEVKRLPKKHQ